MLNPVLYATMVAAFGEVKVVHPDDEGVPPRIYKDPYTGRPFAHWESGDYRGEEYQACCPFCADRHFHLYVNHRYGTRDQCGGWIRTANCFHGCLAHAENRHRLYDMLVFRRGVSLTNELLHKVQSTPVPVKPAAVSTLFGVTPVASLPDKHPAVQYLQSRGYSKDTAAAYSLGYYENKDGSSLTERMANRRLIIPVFQNGEQLGWQARKIFEDMSGPKYFTAPGLPVGRVLYNVDQARNQPFVVLVEGVADVWRIGAPAVCLFGKTLSAGQHALVLDTWKQKPVLIFVDSDAAAESEKIKQQLEATHTGPVRIVRLPEGLKDPGETSPHVLRDLIMEKLNGPG